MNAYKSPFSFSVVMGVLVNSRRYKAKKNRIYKLLVGKKQKVFSGDTLFS